MNTSTEKVVTMNRTSIDTSGIELVNRANRERARQRRKVEIARHNRRARKLRKFFGVLEVAGLVCTFLYASGIDSFTGDFNLPNTIVCLISLGVFAFSAYVLGDTPR